MKADLPCFVELPSDHVDELGTTDGFAGGTHTLVRSCREAAGEL